VPYLSRIIIYPIKSLDGVAVPNATVLQSGALQNDREFAIFDQQNQWVNGKRNAKIHLLRTSFDLEANTVCLQVQESEQQQVFHLNRERTSLENWLSEYFSFPVKLQQNSISGFPDDTEASGPTVISTATLETVASWFPGVEAKGQSSATDEMQQRLRANLEIAGVPAFWEDQLFAEAGNIVQFQIGSIRFEGINPCQRCIVPTRNSLTGKVYPQFQKLFVEKRQETLPSWAPISRFNHYFRLSVNTCIPKSEAGKILQVGDEVKILGIQMPPNSGRN
jgi:uncharacterized protein YcbX